MFDFSAERVTRSVDESLERMGLTYLDAIQVNFYYNYYNKNVPVALCLWLHPARFVCWLLPKGRCLSSLHVWLGSCNIL